MPTLAGWEVDYPKVLEHALQKLNGKKWYDVLRESVCMGVWTSIVSVIIRVKVVTNLTDIKRHLQHIQCSACGGEVGDRRS